MKFETGEPRHLSGRLDAIRPAAALSRISGPPRFISKAWGCRRALMPAQALIRMLGDNNELIMPSGFLPSGERFGLAVDIDKWVIANAIDTLAEQRKTMPNLRYAINISGQSMADQSIANLILAKLHETKLAPSALIFELTETVAIADLALAGSFFRRLREFGCQTALDDFGTGFSSFAYLKDLPVNRVKIDGHFVKNLANNPVDQAMVKAMNDIAHALGKQTVAEFVEQEESMTILRDIGVDFAQGYHLGRPDVVLPCKATAEHTAAQGLCGSGRGCQHAPPVLCGAEPGLHPDK